MTPLRVEVEGLTLDALLWRRFGRPGLLRVEVTLDVNPGLGALGTILPLHLVVMVPDAAPATTSARAPARAISLFD
jgi:phage tail protein X